MSGTSIVKGLFEGIEDQAGMSRSAHSPADDASGESVDHEGDVDEALPSADVGEIREVRRTHVRSRCTEVAIDPVERARSRLVADSRADRLATDDALKAHGPHQTNDPAAGDVDAYLLQLPPDLAHAVNAEVLFEDAPNLDLARDIAAGTNRQLAHIRALGDIVPRQTRGRSDSSPTPCRQ